MQAVKSREQATVGCSPIGHLLEQRARQPRGACEGPVTTTVRERLDARRQQLDHDPEGKLALQRGAARVRVSIPAPAASSPAAPSSELLPIPAAPSTITIAPEPAAAPRSARADLLQLGLAL